MSIFASGGIIGKIWSGCQRRFGLKLIRFLLAGLPSFIVAIPVNFLLVEKLHFGHMTGYACVLFMQVTINFFICRLWVFDTDRSSSVAVQYLQFAGGILFFRAADWGLYSILVKVLNPVLSEFFSLYYLVIQGVNVMLFAFLKFSFSRYVMERKK